MSKSKSQRSRRRGGRFDPAVRKAAKERQAAGKAGWPTGNRRNLSRHRRGKRAPAAIKVVK